MNTPQPSTIEDPQGNNQAHTLSHLSNMMDYGSHQVTPPPHDDFADRCLNSSGAATNNNLMS
uniref:Uncharacterized protein n=1 Tax=Zea mays TaxID=4577 RepID=B4FZ95_MAIZE|nr:unknown [Zea mays]